MWYFMPQLQTKENNDEKKTLSAPACLRHGPQPCRLRPEGDSGHARDARRSISDIPDESTAGVYSIYGAEGVEFGLPYGAELQVVFHAELTDGTRLSAMLTREIMPSANNSADGESETTAMPIILTKD